MDDTHDLDDLEDEDEDDFDQQSDEEEEDEDEDMLDSELDLNGESARGNRRRLLDEEAKEAPARRNYQNIDLS